MTRAPADAFRADPAPADPAPADPVAARAGTGPRGRPRDRDFAFDHAPGLPAPLPAGEAVLWQGRPVAAVLARQAFKTRWITGYLIAIALWRAGGAAADGGTATGLAVLLPHLALAAAGWGVLRLLGWAQARATVYTITTARVILRIGAALPVTYTIPFRCIDAAALAPDAGGAGTGTIALRLRPGLRIGYAMLWPHARPWHLRAPEPALRAIPDAQAVARLLADAAVTRLNEPQIAPVAAPAAAAAVIAAE